MKIVLIKLNLHYCKKHTLKKKCRFTEILTKNRTKPLKVLKIAQSQQTKIDLIKAIPFLKQIRNQAILIKYGGNAMIDNELKNSFASDIATLKLLGAKPVIVHGGGPAIKSLLEKVGKKTEFIDGQRKTDNETMSYVEMALSGQVNSEIVKMINSFGVKAVGISGKDAGLVTAGRRIHFQKDKAGNSKEIDLGQVGKIDQIDTKILDVLINNDFIPVIAPIGTGKNLTDYNINADIFACYIAAALKVNKFILLTDVDGILTDIKDPESKINNLSIKEVKSKIGNLISGGMIPKVEACIHALLNGVSEAKIINGTRKNVLLTELLTEQKTGTTIN